MKHKIIIGDCRQALKALPSNSVHLVITSPPYNIGKGDSNWEDRLPSDEYLELTEMWIKECYRVLVDGGKICVNLPNNGSNNIAFLHYKLMSETGFNFKDNIVWIKWDWQRKDKFSISKWKLDKFKFPGYNPILINAYEIILVMQKNKGYFAGKRDLTYEEFNKWKYNVWFIPALKDRTHPAAYPVELPKRLIKLYSFTNQTVLDPFLGSGTTTKAAMELNRNSIGIEMNPEYVEMVKKRIGYDSVTIEDVKTDKLISSDVSDDLSECVVIDGIRYSLAERIP